MPPSDTSFFSTINGFDGIPVTPPGNAPAVSPVPHDEPVRVGGEGDLIEDGFIRLSSFTHDTSVVAHHASMQQLGEDLQTAVKAVWPNEGGNRYSQVCVLLLSWITDDLGVGSEIQRLRYVFEDLYHFQVHTYQIPDEKPDRAMKTRILEFLGDDKDDTLLVCYYAGHARRGQNEGPLWFPNHQNLLITVPSSGIQTLLEEADSDVLLLYDCCHSAAVTTTGCYQGNKGVKEVIAACGYETIAPEVDKHSFTNTLIEILARTSKGSPFSVSELHSRVLSQLKCWTPCLLYNESGEILENPDGTLVQERQPRRTPIYSVLRESKPRRSIVLSPLIPDFIAPTDESQGIRNTSPRTTEPGPDIDGTTVCKKISKKRKRSTTENPRWPQIVLSVRLDEAKLEISTWREWIRSLPAEAKGIKIEGIYESFSTLLLIRIPVSVWNLLPNNRAYSFVGYVKSENLAEHHLQTHPAGKELPTVVGSSISRGKDSFESEKEDLHSKSTDYQSSSSQVDAYGRNTGGFARSTSPQPSQGMASPKRKTKKRRYVQREPSSQSQPRDKKESTLSEPHFNPSQPLLYYLNDPTHSSPAFRLDQTATLMYTYGSPENPEAREEIQEEIIIESQTRAETSVNGYDAYDRRA